MKIRGHMTRSDFGKWSMRAAAGLAIYLAAVFDAHAQQAAQAQQVQQVIRNGDVLTGQLNALRGRAVKGKRANTFQLVSEPHRLPPPNGLCGLETGPETFQIVTSNAAQAAQLKGFIGKEVSFKVDEVSCAQDAGQFSEAVVTKWSVVTKH
jgi:hypothetical protein